ncbi:MAG: response regulator [Dehalococcoidia bacterium]
MRHADSPPTEFRKTGFAQQAVVRVGIGLFMGIYFSLTEYITHPLYLSFVVYALVSYALSRSVWRSRISTYYLAATLLLDVSFTLLSLYVVEAYGYFLFLILIQICFGYGVRYGSTVLWAATFVVCAGILLLFLVSDYWAARPYEAISFFVGVPFLALYIHYLNNQLRKAKRLADTQAATNSRLLRFVSHDMRTQLQALLYTTESIRHAGDAPEVANAVDTIEDTVHSLARISSSFVKIPATRKRVESSPIDSPLPGSRFALGRWLGRLCGRFDALLKERNITLHVHFADEVPTVLSTDRIALERLLLNCISNAARFSTEGRIEIALERERHATTADQLVILIGNRSPHGFKARVVDEGGMAGPELFFGAGLGLSINEDIAASIGGSFAAEATAVDSFSCVLKFPVSKLADLEPEPLVLPVYCCSHSPDTVRAVRSHLAHTCNVLAHFAPAATSAATCAKTTGPAAYVLDKRAAIAWMNHDYAQPSAVRDCMVILDGRSMEPGSGRAETSASAVLAALSLQNAVHFASAYNGRDQSVTAAFGGAKQREISFRGLYVEDGAFNAKRLIAEAQNAGWNVEHAPGVDEAMCKLRAHDYDFVLLDWELGDATALAVLDGLALQYSSFAAPIFILSAHDKSQLESLLEHRSVRAILEKPLSATALMQHVARQIEDEDDEPGAVYPLPEPVTDIFQSETYEMLLVDLEAHARTASLLDSFSEEVESLIAAIAHAVSANSNGTGRLLHQLAGTAGTGGAVYLANSAEDLCKTLRRVDRVPPLDLTVLHVVWGLTRKHIDLFRSTLGPAAN